MVIILLLFSMSCGVNNVRVRYTVPTIINMLLIRQANEYYYYVRFRGHLFARERPSSGGRRVVVVRSHSRRRRLAANRREFRCSGVYSTRFRHVVAVIR